MRSSTDSICMVRVEGTVLRSSVIHFWEIFFSSPDSNFVNLSDGLCFIWRTVGLFAVIYVGL
jgi:hypothetical protein